MTKKSDLIEKMTESVTAKEELTQSLSELLGPRLNPPGEARCLLRLRDGKVSEELARHLRVEPFAGTSFLQEHSCPVVLGPFLFSEVQSLVADALVSPWDHLMKGGDRWKPLKAHFPEFSKTGGDLTATAAVTDSGFTAEEHLEPAESLELEDSDSTFEKEEQITQVRSMNPGPPAPPASLAPESHAGPSPATAERLERPDRVSRRPEKSQRADTPRASPVFSWAWAPAIVVLVAAAAWYLRKTQSLPNQSVSTSSQKPTGQEQKVEQRALPERLIPLGLDQLWREELPQLRRVRFLNLVFQQGQSSFSQSELRQVRAAADPASSSWELRRFGSNLLAAHLLTLGQPSEAHRILKGLYDSSPSDPSTVLNLSLAELALRQNQQALELATLGSKLCPQTSFWICATLQSYVEWKLGDSSSAQRLLEVTSRDPVARGWAQGLNFLVQWEKKPIATSEVQKLGRLLLSQAPDLLSLSPVAIPVALPLVAAEVRRAFQSWSSAPWSDLTEGQKLWVKQDPSAFERLRGENSFVSQILSGDFAYRQGQFGDAKDLALRAIAQLEAQPAASSWPWALAGDAALETQDWAVALLNYEKALSRDPQDARSLLGQSLVLRAQGDYTSAQQRLEEALVIDPHLLPARLRMTRSSWYTLPR